MIYKSLPGVFTEKIFVTFDLPEWIREGLLNGTYERVGGIIKYSTSKRIVAWLREIQMADRLVEPLAVLSTTSSLLSLGVSVAGFALINMRLLDIEKRLQQAQEILNQINLKIDFMVIANFRAALTLATNAISLKQEENRKSSALAAINRFLEAEHIYTSYVDQELGQKSQIVDEYLLALSLAYVAEARCYLELGELDTALQRIQEGADIIQPRLKKYIEILLTSNPSAYLDPEFKGKISLARLTKIYQWLNPDLDINSVFELLRDNIFSWPKARGLESGFQWVNSLPTAIVASQEVKGSIFGNKVEMQREAMQRLPDIIDIMESMIETFTRFTAYQIEIQAIKQLDIPFHQWAALPISNLDNASLNLVYIVPKEAVTI